MPVTPDARTRGPLELDGWAEFNRVTWNVRPERVTLATSDQELPHIDACLYHDGRGRIRRPPRNIYTPVVFSPTATMSLARITRQWHDAADLFVRLIQERGLAGTMALPPEIHDVRPWIWAGFTVGVRYTAWLDTPYDFSLADGSVRNKARKADRAGYRCTRESRPDHVIRCLEDTEGRQGFDHRLKPGDLEAAADLLGPDHFRTYLSYAPDGTPAAARIMLHNPGARAIDWVAGTLGEHLNSGATQALIHFALDDLAAASANGFDFAGVNIPSVAAAKEAWGAVVTPYYTVSAPRGRFALARGAATRLAAIASRALPRRNR